MFRPLQQQIRNLQMEKINLIMRDYAHQDTRSTHAELCGYGDRREDHGLFGGDDLDKALASRDELKDVCDQAKKVSGLIENQGIMTHDLIQKVSFNLLMGSLIATILSLF